MSFSARRKLSLEMFATLPSELIIDIFLRLPDRCLIYCKCVCKSWLNLIGTDDFVKSHLSMSVPVIAIGKWCCSKSHGIIEFRDDIEDKILLSFTKLHFPNSFKYTFLINGSADGLLFLHKTPPLCLHQIDPREMSYSLLICNPITREYIDLNPQKILSSDTQVLTQGYGKSKITRKYKVVMLIRREALNECVVYTIGTGSWRNIEYDALLDYKWHYSGAFVNGNLHWLACDLKGFTLISCFDLETERFATFHVPPSASRSTTSYERHVALEDCLCLCIKTTMDETEIWLMNEYGEEKSWTKKFVVTKHPEYNMGVVPFKVFRDGDFLLLNDYLNEDLTYYSNKNKTFREIEIPGISYYFTPTIHISSFLSLKSFVMENSISY